MWDRDSRIDSKRDLSVSLNLMLGDEGWRKSPAGGLVATTRAKRLVVETGKDTFLLDTRDVRAVMANSLSSSSDMSGFGSKDDPVN